MKIKSIKFFCTVALLVNSLNVSAVDVWSGYTSVTMLYSTTTYLVFYTQYSHSLSTCNGGTRWKLDINNSSYDEQVSILLASFMANKQIDFAFDDAQPASCNPTVSRFRVPQ